MNDENVTIEEIDGQLWYVDKDGALMAPVEGVAEKPKAGSLPSLLRGMGHAAAGQMLGLQGLFTGDAPQTRAAADEHYAETKRLMEEAPVSTVAGEVLGGIPANAAIAAPATWAASRAKLIDKLRRIPRVGKLLTPLAAATAGGAATNAALAPVGTDQTRAGNAVIGGAAGAALGSASQLAKPVVEAAGRAVKDVPLIGNKLFKPEGVLTGLPPDVKAALRAADAESIPIYKKQINNPQGVILPGNLAEQQQAAIQEAIRRQLNVPEHLPGGGYPTPQTAAEAVEKTKSILQGGRQKTTVGGEEVLKRTRDTEEGLYGRFYEALQFKPTKAGVKDMKQFQRKALPRWNDEADPAQKRLSKIASDYVNKADGAPMSGKAFATLFEDLNGIAVSPEATAAARQRAREMIDVVKRDLNTSVTYANKLDANGQPLVREGANFPNAGDILDELQGLRNKVYSVEKSLRDPSNAYTPVDTRRLANEVEAYGGASTRLGDLAKFDRTIPLKEGDSGPVPGIWGNVYHTFRGHLPSSVAGGLATGASRAVQAEHNPGLRAILYSTLLNAAQTVRGAKNIMLPPQRFLPGELEEPTGALMRAWKMGDRMGARTGRQAAPLVRGALSEAAAAAPLEEEE